MIAIRGAVTVETDSAENIKKSVKMLMEELFRRNGLTGENLVCMIFTNTFDLRSYYPATAAREAGFGLCPLFSAQEPEIDGALVRCVRVMVLAEGITSPSHVYLGGAAELRRDLQKVYSVALDGPAGSGKSTVSKILGKELNILCLDTGAMYRACALKCMREKIDINDENAVNKVAESLDLQVKYLDGAQKTYLDGCDVSGEIRSPGISMAASTVSAFGCVRNKMVALQREIAAKNSCVVDGRDIGTNVLPDADFKFYLTASPEVRAKRRQLENLSKGFPSEYGEILEDIKKRDEQDKNRKIAPLRKAPDAVLIDSSDMTIEQVVKFITDIITESKNDGR